MSQNIIITPEYQDFIKDLKTSIVQARHIAVRKVNTPNHRNLVKRS